jgi:DNA-binding MarR family transcriptional regulator
MSRSLDSQPWGPSGRPLHDAHTGFSNSAMSVRAAAPLVRHAHQYGVYPSQATIELKSGLTRRGVVYEYVRTHPGAYVRGMARDLRIGTGDLQYHLSWLEKHGFVKTRKSGFYRFVYPTMVFQDEQEVLLGVLSLETPRELLLCLLGDPTMTQGDLARTLGHSQPTVSWHMDRLLQLGVVRKERTSRGVVYEVVADRDDILSFVKSYHSGVWKRWAGRLASLAVSAGAKAVDKSGSAQTLGLTPTAAAAVVELIGHS